MKIKSVSDLAFKALDALTEGESAVRHEEELWVAHAIFNLEARHTGEIQKIMKDDCGVPHYTVQRILARLVSKNIVYRVLQGVYAPNLRLVLDQMIEILEAEGAPDLPRPDGQTDTAREEKTQSHTEDRGDVGGFLDG